MISFSPAQRYFLYSDSCDMRKSFRGLSGVVSSVMQRDCLNGDVYIFINKRRNKIKLLVWDRSGFVIYYKQLAEGTFELPHGLVQDKSLSIEWNKLVLILEGVKLESVEQRKRFFRKK